MNRLALSLILLILGLSLLLHAQTAAPTLDAVVREVWSVSPQLAGQREQLTLAKGDVWRRYLINEPQLLLGTTDNDSGHSFGLGLTVPFPGKSQAFAESDRVHETAAERELRAKRYDLTKMIVQSYLDCAFSNEALAVQKATTTDLQNLSHSLEKLYEAGHSSQAEKIGSELTANQSAWDLETATDRQRTLCFKYSQILAKAKGESVVPEGQERLALDLPDDLDAATVASLGELTSDQLRAQQTKDIAHVNGQLAIWAQMPDLTFNVLRNNYVYLPASPAGKAWTTSASLTVTLPILFPFHETIESRRVRSQSEIDQNAALLQMTAANADQDDAAKEYQRSQRRLKDLRAHDLVLARALVESTYAEYRSAHLGYAELILSRRTLADLRNQDLQLRVETINAHLRCLTHCGEPIHAN